MSILEVLGLRRRAPAEPDYRARMRATLEKVRMAELQIAESTSLEELDMGRAALQVAHAELQHLIRAAKRERGLEVRSVQEAEELHRQLVANLYDSPARRDLAN